MWVNVVNRKGNVGQLEYFIPQMEKPLVSVILQYNDQQVLDD